MATTSPITRTSIPPTERCAISRTFLREAHGRGLRVITELVLNHTSDQHAWFQRSRRAAPGIALARFLRLERHARQVHAKRASSSRISKPPTGAWDPVAKAYYWHRFYSHQPDSEFRQSRRCARPCCTSSISGSTWASTDCAWTPFRICTSAKAPTARTCPRRTQFLKELRAHIDRAVSRTACCWPKPTSGPRTPWPISATATNATWPFTFPLMPRLFMAMRMEDRFPIVDILQQTPADSRHLPVGDVPAQSRRADARNGDRRRARLHVPHLRPRPRRRASTWASAAGSRRCSKTTAAASS